MIQRFGVLGSGVVGQTLARGLQKHGYEVRIGSRTPEKLAEFGSSTGIGTGTFDEVAAWGEGLVLAVRGDAAGEVLGLAGGDNVAGKLVIDTTNPISKEPPDNAVIRYFTGANNSLMEELQTMYPEARFVKAFSSVGNAMMVDPDYGGTRPTMFICGNDPDAKAETTSLLEKFGWDVADVGSVTSARAIEPLCQLWCLPGFLQNSWTHAFHLLRKQ